MAVKPREPNRKGGKPNKLRRLELEQRRSEVMQLRLRGLKQLEIALRMDVSQQSISKDIRAIREQCKETALDALEEIRAEELARINLTEAEAWKAWERSI